MKNLRFILLLICGIFTIHCTIAQQLFYNNQYLVNNYSLSPAYAGYNQNLEAYAGTRMMWGGVPGAPSLQHININGRMMDKMGIGCTVSSENAGIFSATTALLTYAYHLTINGTQSAGFGVSAGMRENHIDLSGSKTQSNSDPVALMNEGNIETSLQSAFGAFYRCKDFNAGFVIPNLLEPKSMNDSGKVIFTLKRHYLVHASYLFSVSKLLQIEPILITRSTANTPFFYELSMVGKFRQQAWLGLTYRKGSALGVSLGALPFDRVAINYTYEFSGSGIGAASSGTHELTLGLLIGENKNKSTSVFNGTGLISTKKPYYNWVE